MASLSGLLEHIGMHVDGWMAGERTGEEEGSRYSDPTEEVIFPKQSPD